MVNPFQGFRNKGTGQYVIWQEGRVLFSEKVTVTWNKVLFCLNIKLISVYMYMDTFYVYRV
jgi:hypothetical protein